MTSATPTPVFGICGWKKSGKTTLTVRLVEELTRRGYKVATVKHAHHEFQVDDQETDSARHRRAGAGEVAVIGGKRWAIIHDLKDEPEPSLEEVLSWLSPSDLVLVEGYKSAAIPKIEARRSVQQDKRPLAPRDPNIVGIATDHETEANGLPVFALDDVASIADFIERTVRPIKGATERRRENRPSDHQS